MASVWRRNHATGSMLSRTVATARRRSRPHSRRRAARRSGSPEGQARPAPSGSYRCRAFRRLRARSPRSRLAAGPRGAAGPTRTRHYHPEHRRSCVASPGAPRCGGTMRTGRARRVRLILTLAPREAPTIAPESRQAVLRMPVAGPRLPVVSTPRGQANCRQGRSTGPGRAALTLQSISASLPAGHMRTLWSAASGC
jgi:hypothetical protein